MFAFSNLSHLEIRKRLLENMSLTANNEIDPVFRQQLESDDYIEDVCKIGALLSDERMCKAYCARLNDSLIEYAKKINVYSKMATGANQTSLKPSPGRGPKEHRLDILGADDLDSTVEKHKQYKVISGFLSEFEAAHKFNEGSYTFMSLDKKGVKVTLSASPQKAVTLPGFVRPEVFQTNLLAKARHFKDPSVSPLHGEFTHRIQWYIVCEYVRLMKHMKKSPADIFKACARPIFIGKKTTVWDQVFEGGTDAKDFRKPEAITEYFLRASAPDHPHHQSVWFLAGLTAGRYAKRQIERGA